MHLCRLSQVIKQRLREDARIGCVKFVYEHTLLALAAKAATSKTTTLTLAPLLRLLFFGDARAAFATAEAPATQQVKPERL
jgi:hypothetical protein